MMQCYCYEQLLVDIGDETITYLLSGWVCGNTQQSQQRQPKQVTYLFLHLQLHSTT